MTEAVLPEYVDILIPSKDRPMQLHLLLESMGKHLTGIGRITITWQGSKGEYSDGYELLKKRVSEDNAFASLRNNSKEIVFRQRKSLREVYDASIESGDSKYILPLVDDDVFFHAYDLVNTAASKLFFENISIVSCSLRLGDNLSDQVSKTLGDGLTQDISTGHASSLLSTGKPRYLHPQHGHYMPSHNEVNNCDTQYLMWAWVDNLNVPHWSVPLSTTSNIFRKSEYLNFMGSIGRENFLLIEGIAGRAKLEEFFNLPGILITILKYMDKLQSKVLKRYGVYEQDIFQIQLSKLLYRKRSHQIRSFDVPVYMVAPPQSVVVNLDIGASYNRGIGLEMIADYNKKYIDGFVISYDSIPFASVKFPLQIFGDFSFVEYVV